MVRVERKKGFPTWAKFADSDHPVHAKSIIRVFALHSYILQYPMILLVDGEGPDQSARVCKLLWDFAVHTSGTSRSS